MSADFSIEDVQVLENLDSGSNPTVRVDVRLDSGATGWAGLPSGASTGSKEAAELRDGDPERFGGKGVRAAVGNVHHERDLTRSRPWSSLAELDAAIVATEGTQNKLRLGANSMIGVSMDVARGERLAQDNRLVDIAAHLPEMAFDLAGEER